MKLNKSKNNKGKVHPSPSPSSSSSSSSSNDAVSTLKKLLPAAILTLISVLSLQDKEVVAYMITHNRHSTSKKKSVVHKVPSFDCGCFECYTSYWFRWDSSPNRDLIHLAIDSFEEHQHQHLLCNSDPLTNSTTRKRPPSNNNNNGLDDDQSCCSSLASTATATAPGDVASSSSSSSRDKEDSHDNGADDVEERGSVSGVHQEGNKHKGLARKVLPDVIGLFNSRLWNLWGPNV